MDANYQSHSRGESSEAHSPFESDISGWTIFAVTVFGAVIAMLLRNIEGIPVARTLTVTYFAFIAGMLIEARKYIEPKWFRYGLIFSALLSLTAFLPGKHEQEYNFQDHLDSVPFVFAFFFLLLTSGFVGEKKRVRLGEGIALLHAMMLFYYFCEVGRHYGGFKGLLILSGLPFVYSLIHSLTYIKLSNRARLFLSVWSSVSMAVFAVLYVVKLWSFDPAEDLYERGQVADAVMVVLEFFLFGAAGPYIVHNAIMLIDYLPDKHSGIHKYPAQIRRLNREHIERFSADQIDKRHALLVLVLIGGGLLGNYLYGFVDPSFAIGIGFTVAPFVVGLLEKQTSASRS